MLCPPCTLKSGESEPGLEPRCPLHLPLSEVQADRRTGDTTSAGVPGSAFAGQFCCILGTCWDMALSITVPALWCPVAESAGRQAGRELQCASADRTAERSRAGMLGALGTETSVALVEAAALHPDCPRGLRGAALPLHPGRASAPVGSRKQALRQGRY